MSQTGDAKTRRTALRILVFLGILIALSCFGSIVFFQSTLGEIDHSLAALDANVRERLPEGSVWQLAERTAAAEGRAPTETVHLMLAIGLPDDAGPQDAASLRATAWEAYCDAFDAGGLHLGSVAVGQSAGSLGHGRWSGAGHVIDWEDESEDAASIEERTGRAAPPDAAVVRWFGNAIRLQENE